MSEMHRQVAVVAEAAPLVEPTTVAIGDARIGTGRRVYIVAEVGVNHNGDVNAAMQMVDAALAAGADAVKFQIFRAADLVTEEAATASYQKRATGSSSQREMLARLELRAEDYYQIRKRCRGVGIEFLATPFSEDDLRRLLALKVRAVKIASTDLNNTPLLTEAAGAGLPLIVSTGASDGDEIARSVAGLQEMGCGDRLILLHCVSSYPTAWEGANLRAIGTLQRRFGVPVGFSDHTASVETGALAVAAGASVLEKHFTLDRSLPGPDQALSLESDDLGDYIARVRHAEAALGDGELAIHESEQQVRYVARKSVVATRDLAPGDVLSSSCLTTKRPAGGIEPDQMKRLIGRRVAVSVRADTCLSWEMIE